MSTTATENNTQLTQTKQQAKLTIDLCSDTTDGELADKLTTAFLKYSSLLEKKQDDLYITLYVELTIKLPYPIIATKTLAVLSRFLPTITAQSVALEFIQKTFTGENEYVVDFFQSQESEDIRITALDLPGCHTLANLRRFFHFNRFIELIEWHELSSMVKFGQRETRIPEWVPVFQGIQSNPHTAIKDLDLFQIKLVPEEVTALALLLKVNRSIERLGLTACGLDDIALETIILSIRDNTKSGLQYLSIAANLPYIKDAPRTLAALVSLVESDQAIDEISTGGGSVSCIETRLLCARHKNPHAIFRKIMYRNPINDDLLLTIAGILAKDARVKELELFNCKLHTFTQSLEKVFSNIQANPNTGLTHLILSGGAEHFTLDVNAFNALKSLLRTNRVLTELQLERELETLLTDKQCAELLHAIQLNRASALSFIKLSGAFHLRTLSATASFLRHSTTVQHFGLHFDFGGFESIKKEEQPEFCEKLISILRGLTENDKTVLRMLSLPFPEEVKQSAETSAIAGALLKLLESNRTIITVNSFKKMTAQYCERNEAIANRIDFYWSLFSILVVWNRANAQNGIRNSILSLTSIIMPLMAHSIEIPAKQMNAWANRVLHSRYFKRVSSVEKTEAEQLELFGFQGHRTPIYTRSKSRLEHIEAESAVTRPLIFSSVSLDIKQTEEKENKQVVETAGAISETEVKSARCCDCVIS